MFRNDINRVDRRRMLQATLWLGILAISPACSKKNSSTKEIVNELADILQIKGNLLGKMTFQADDYHDGIDVELEAFNEAFRCCDKTDHMQRLKDIILEEYQNGEMVNVSGWLLTITEKRLLLLSYAFQAIEGSHDNR